MCITGQVQRGFTLDSTAAFFSLLTLTSLVCIISSSRLGQFFSALLAMMQSSMALFSSLLALW
jgi:hypothetical protein